MNPRLPSELSLLAPMLYVPANRPDLPEVIAGSRNLGVCCLAICLEDSVRPDDRPAAAEALCRALQSIPSLPRPVFARPASAAALAWLLEQDGIERLAGFILPKATVDTIHLWLELTRNLFTILPILESPAAIDPWGRRDLAQACAAHRSLIPCARIGANDLFALLGGLRRPKGRIIYETPVGTVIDGLIEAFSAQDIRLCGPVFDRLDDHATFELEISADIDRGLFAKTSLNPRQVEQVWRCYEPKKEEIEEAERILQSDSPAVFGLNGAMVEPACHSEWARRLLERWRIFSDSDLKLLGFNRSDR
jgi:citrate lyase beta subunit